MIGKLQRPLNNANAPWLFYTKGRKHVGQLPESILPDWVRNALSFDLKAYFYVRIEGQNVEFLSVATEQDW